MCVFTKISVIDRFTAGRPALKKIVDNISWLFLDKIIRMGVGLLVGAWVARYLGPDQFGLWNYAIAFTSLFGAFATLGLDGIVVRELVKYPEKTNELLGTAFTLRLLGGLLTFFLSIVTAIVIGNRDFLTLSLIALSAGGFVFQAFLTIDYFYQAHVMSRYTVWAQNIAFLIMSLVKIGLILLKASLLSFAIAGLIEIILGSAFLVGFYIYQNSINVSPLTSSFSLLGSWRFSPTLAKSLLKDSWPLILSGVAVMIYMRIDQVMLKIMLDDRAVGLYSAAVRISEVWYFIPMIIAQSVFPSILNAKKVSEELYYVRLQKLYNLMVLCGILMVFLLLALKKIIVLSLFGIDYIDSVNVFRITILNLILIFISSVHSKWLLAEGLQSYSLFYSICGMIINIGVNLFFIPKYGIVAAAYGTLVTQIAPYILLLRNSKTRKQLKMILTSFILISYIKRGGKA